MKTTVNMVEARLYTAFDQQQNKTSIDMRPGEEKKGSSPMEILLSALGACSGVEVILMLQKKKKNVSQFSIEIEGTQTETHPKLFTDIHCCYQITSPDVEKEELHKVIEMALEKYCSVGASLKSKITFSVEIKK